MHYWEEQTKDDSFNPSNLTSFKELTQTAGCDRFTDTITI